MGGLPERLVAQIGFMAGGDVLHQILSKRPNHLAKIIPNKIQHCQLLQGQFGTTGSVIQWKYTLDGKESTAKQIIEDVDEEKKQISFRMIGGDLLELYKNMVITFHYGVDHYIIWSIEYELISADNPHPISLLNFFVEYVKEVDAHIYG